MKKTMSDIEILQKAGKLGKIGKEIPLAIENVLIDKILLIEDDRQIYSGNPTELMCDLTLAIFNIINKHT